MLGRRLVSISKRFASARSRVSLSYYLSASPRCSTTLQALPVRFNKRLPYYRNFALASSSEADVNVSNSQKNEKFRKDYCPTPYLVESLNLDFQLMDAHTVVTSLLTVRRRPSSESFSFTESDLQLDGEDLKLHTVTLNGKTLIEDEHYSVSDSALTIFYRALPLEPFVLSTTVEVYPSKNTQLSGLYESNGVFCTQCEAEGFRRITYFLDRPDVLTKYQVRIEADCKRFPVLLSNGNLIGKGQIGNRHWTEWHDPFNKPCYLFALVAGDLGVLSDSFKTKSGREVTLNIFSDHKNVDKLQYAMDSLKRAMKWDEERFGLEYDLDVYHVVAVNDFNMGAMENKGLNVFNSALVFATPSTATDTDYERIERVIGHEYFHNWTGNRVTCRDWFQLTLKEGLTVFRDQLFMADMGSATLKRIEDVKAIKSRQFAEDASPLAHPIRPESYISMDNFYTATVYEKGAEVIRMLHTLLGEAGFRKGMDLYFQRHDGQAVSCCDFLSAMADANNRDLSQFEHWYSQKGTPVVSVRGGWEQGKYVVKLEQRLPSNTAASNNTVAVAAAGVAAGVAAATNLLSSAVSSLLSSSSSSALSNSSFTPLHIPFAICAYGEDGKELCAPSLLELTKQSQIFTLFEGKQQQVTLSVNQNFSAPVKLDYPQSNAELSFLMVHDSDGLNRWEAGQQLMTNVLLDRDSGEDLVMAFEEVLKSSSISDLSLKAFSLQLPDELALQAELTLNDPLRIHSSREKLRVRLAQKFKEEFLSLYKQLSTSNKDLPISTARGRRRLRSTCLWYLSQLPGGEELCYEHYRSAECMTDSIAGIANLCSLPGSRKQEALSSFYDFAKRSNELVLDKWFMLQASADSPNLLEEVKALTLHPDYSLLQPNRMRAVAAAFANNQAHFHRTDGEGYRFLTNLILKVDAANPQVAARLASAFARWRSFGPQWSDNMKAQLEIIRSHPDISPDTLEVCTRSLS